VCMLKTPSICKTPAKILEKAKLQVTVAKESDEFSKMQELLKGS